MASPRLFRTGTATLLLVIVAATFTAADEPGTAWAKLIGIETYDTSGESAVDGAGNIYVVVDLCCSQNILHSYTSDGALRWTRPLGNASVRDMVADHRGAIYLASEGFIVRKIDTGGAVMWEEDIYVPGFGASAYSIELGPAGEVYAVGARFIHRDEFPSLSDLLVVMFDSTGTEQWRYVYDDTVYSYTAEPIATAVDSQGVYITGYTYALISLDPAGTERFIRVATPEPGKYAGYGLEFGSDNYLYAAGYDQSVPGDGMYLVKYTTSGDTVWTRTFTDSSLSHIHAYGIRLSVSDNIHILSPAISPDTGCCTHFVSALATYDIDGKMLWKDIYDAPGFSASEPRQLTVGPDGSPYVGCRRYSLDRTDWQITTLKYTPTGSIEWIRYFSGDFEGTDEIRAVHVAPDGSLYVVGHTRLPDTYFDATVIKYAPCGDIPLGDLQPNGVITSADVIAMVNYIYRGAPLPVPCPATADINCDGTPSAADIIGLVSHVFKSGPAPCDLCPLIDDGRGCP